MKPVTQRQTPDFSTQHQRTLAKDAAHLFWKDCYVLVKGLWWADVPARDARVPGGASRQLALLEDQREQGEERVPEKGRSYET